MKRNIHYPGRVSLLLAAALIVLPMSGVKKVYASSIEEYLKKYDRETAEIYESGDYSYQIVEDGSAIIIKYSGNEKEIEIPAEIGGQKVVAIGEEAFSELKIKSLMIPKGVSVIESRAFEYCEIAESLQLPQNITIEESAFAYAALPAQVTLPSGTVAGTEAFAYCENLETLLVESQAVVKERSFNYSKDLQMVVCAESSVLEDLAFEYCATLEKVCLCGDVEIYGDPFSYCDEVKVEYLEAGDIATERSFL